MVSKEKLYVTVFFAAFLLLGILVYKDYGMGPDERTQREYGLIVYNYIFNGNDSLLSYKDRDYGPFFEVSLIVIEKTLNLTDSEDIFYVRHLVNYLFFYISAIFFYLLLKKYIIKNWKISLLGTLFFFLSPRMFAESFYNSKDIIFMSSFLISIYTLIRFKNKLSIKNALFHAIACAICIDIRVLGVLIPFITFIILVDYNKNIKIVISRFKYIIVFIVFLIPIIILFWPTLWTNPLFIIDSFKRMSNFTHGSLEFFFGVKYELTNLPWYFVPTWIFMSTPLIYSVLFIMGLIFVLKKISKENIIFLSTFFIPIIMIILLNSTIYDTWRHVYFVYPSFLIIAIIGLKNLLHIAELKNLVIFFTVFSLVLVALFMIKNHPYQNMFFNFLVMKTVDIENNLELDYWAVSYTDILRYIAKIDSRDNINITYVGMGPQVNKLILSKEDRDRLFIYDVHFLDLSEEQVNNSNYFITNYRWWQGSDFNCNKIYNITVEGLEIASACRLK